MRNTKFCIFCGQKPEKKTKEHVIPRWLIESTGDPSRVIHLGPLMTSRKPIGFAYDQLHFPACKGCNERYGTILEAEAQRVMTRVLAYEAISSANVDMLLDWFDKVRIGLWLGYHQMLDQNFWGVHPHFHIADRIGTTDRALIIYRTVPTQKRVTFVGVNTPAFAHYPVCFSLLVNEFCFVNIATDFLVARQAGLPFPRSISMLQDYRMRASALRPAKGKLHAPLLDFKHDERGSVIAQAIFRKYQEADPKAYGVEFVKQATLSPGRQRPLIERSRTASFYPGTESTAWLPGHVLSPEEFINDLGIRVLNIQVDLMKRVHPFQQLSADDKALIRDQYENLIKFNETLIEAATTNNGAMRE